MFWLRCSKDNNNETCDWSFIFPLRCYHWWF
jgi:hypothetical protein